MNTEPITIKDPIIKGENPWADLLKEIEEKLKSKEIKKYGQRI